MNYILLTISFALALIGVISSAREKAVPISKFGWSILALASLAFAASLYKESTDADATRLASNLRLAQELENLSKQVANPLISLEAKSKSQITDLQAIFGQISASAGQQVIVTAHPTPYGGATVFTFTVDEKGALEQRQWNPVSNIGSFQFARNLPDSEDFAAVRMKVAGGEQPGRLFEQLSKGGSYPVRVNFKCSKDNPNCTQALRDHWLRTLPSGRVTYPIEGSRWAIAIDLKAEKDDTAMPDRLSLRYRVNGSPELYGYRK